MKCVTQAGVRTESINPAEDLDATLMQRPVAVRPRACGQHVMLPVSIEVRALLDRVLLRRVQGAATTTFMEQSVGMVREDNHRLLGNCAGRAARQQRPAQEGLRQEAPLSLRA